MSSMVIASDIAKIVQELYLLRLTIKDLTNAVNNLPKLLIEAQNDVAAQKAMK